VLFAKTTVGSLCCNYSIINFYLQEELAEGLHLIDFEQLKIENQTYNEKIEERNEVRCNTG